MAQFQEMLQSDEGQKAMQEDGLKVDTLPDACRVHPVAEEHVGRQAITTINDCWKTFFTVTIAELSGLAMGGMFLSRSASRLACHT